tara:strand:+ start:323 stop:718 length:396 start_codon:yes stop_codon:yes gene_type:complete
MVAALIATQRTCDKKAETFFFSFCFREEPKKNQLLWEHIIPTSERFRFGVNVSTETVEYKNIYAGSGMRPVDLLSGMHMQYEGGTQGGTLGGTYAPGERGWGATMEASQFDPFISSQVIREGEQDLKFGIG